MKTTKTPDYLNGVLDPDSFLGFATITEHVVIDVLGDAIKENFGSSYDLISESLGKVNVKSSALRKEYPNRTYWQFSKSKNAKIPDNYVCLGMDKYNTEILKVWVIPGHSEVVTEKGITISHRRDERVKRYEKDHVIYDKTFQEMDIHEKTEFRNTTKPKINETRLILKKMDLEYKEDFEPVKDKTPSKNPIMFEFIEHSAPLQKLVLLSIAKVAQKHKFPLEYGRVSSYCLNLAEKHNYPYVSFRRVQDSIGLWGICGIIKTKYPKIKSINVDCKEIERIILQDPEFAEIKQFVYN